ncbi:MAG: DUF4282 domain-containing protein [Vitreimonas sp.]
MVAQFVRRLLSFDRLIGPRLVRIVYVFGSVMIVLALGGALMSGAFALAGGNVGGGLMQFIAAPAVAAVAFVYWRFLCELFMLAFLAYERMGEIRDLLSGRPAPAAHADQNHPQF